MVLLNIVLYLVFLLVLTIVIESITITLFGKQELNIYKTVIVANLLTNPVLNIVNLLYNNVFFGTEMQMWLLIVLEFVVVYVEYRIFKYIFGYRIDKQKLLIYAFVINAVSFIVGIITEEFWFELFFG